MAVLKIRINPDPVLRKKARKVTSLDNSVQKLIDDMIDTMHESQGIGLAANQVGVPLRIVVIHLPDEKDVLVLINPEVVERRGERRVVEGCLSIPGYQGEITRAQSVKVKAKDRNGKLIRKKASNNLLANCLEHEIDHLNGILYIDHMADTDKLFKTENELAE